MCTCIAAIKETYTKVRHQTAELADSPLYKGMKTAVENYRDCVSDFQELCSDLQTFNIDVPRNEKCREVEELLRKLA